MSTELDRFKDERPEEYKTWAKQQDERLRKEGLLHAADCVCRRCMRIEEQANILSGFAEERA